MNAPTRPVGRPALSASGGPARKATLKLPLELWGAVDALATARGVSWGEEARLALVRHVARRRAR